MSERSPNYDPNYKFGSEGEPAQIEKAKLENLTVDHIQAGHERKTSWNEKFDFESAAEAIEASKHTGFWRRCLDTPENRTYLEQRASGVITNDTIGGVSDNIPRYVHSEVSDGDVVIDEGWSVDLVRKQ